MRPMSQRERLGASILGAAEHWPSAGEEERRKLSSHIDVPAVGRAVFLPQVCIARPRKLQVTSGMPPTHTHLERSKPCIGMGLFPVSTPSTSFSTIPVAWLMRAYHPAQGTESPTPAGLLSFFPNNCSKSCLSISTTSLGSSQRHLGLGSQAGLLRSQWRSTD